MFEAFSDFYNRCRLGACIYVPSLNTVTDTNKTTIDEFTKEMTDAGDALNKKGFISIPALVGHLQAEQMVNYIKLAVNNETLRPDYREVFKDIRAHIALEKQKDPRLVSLPRIQKKG